MAPHFHALIVWATLATLATSTTTNASDLMDRVQHHYATNDQDQTKIHFVSIGDGPLVVLIHGFPDYWYSWADQMEHLSKDYRCVAMDLRGYNLSDQPADLKSYDMSLLVGDVTAVIKSCQSDHAVVVGHDWGGAIAWTIALSQPELVSRLIVCNLPHPRGLKRELLINDEHRENTSYARDFQDPEYHKRFTSGGLTTLLEGLTNVPWSDRKKANYRQAFDRSDFNGMLNYYRQNYKAELAEKPPLPYHDPDPVAKARMPILMFHGLLDKALHHHALNNTWEWVDRDLTIVTLPDAGHWVHHDESDLVSSTMYDWLRRRR